MSSLASISSIGNFAAMQPGRHSQRPDPTQMAETLFSKLDASGQGYIEKSDLAAAFSQLGANTSTGSSTSSVDELFTKLDSDSDGKVTKQEFSDTLRALAEQMDQQFQSMRMQAAMPQRGGDMPPPPPPGGHDGGMTKDQLSTMASAVAGSDSAATSQLSELIANFDAADTNQDGKVSFNEAIAFDQSGSSASSQAASGQTESSPSSTSDTSELRLMRQIAQLMDAYGIGRASAADASASTLSVSA